MIDPSFDLLIIGAGQKETIVESDQVLHRVCYREKMVKLCSLKMITYVWRQAQLVAPCAVR